VIPRNGFRPYQRPASLSRFPLNVPVPVLPIPLADLRAQFLAVEADVRAAIERVLASQRFILGPEVDAFEQAVASYTRCAHAVGLSSGTDAILVALMALGIGPSDEVITTPYTFVATVSPIARLGARAVFVDIDPQTFTLDATHLDAAITPRTRAILPVHLFGQMADMRAIHAIADSRGVPVIEDAAQAIGADRDGLTIGRASKAATLSFFPSKNLGAMGDAGMLLTSDSDLASRARLLRNHGQEAKYVSQVLGGNFRLDELQAAVLGAKLPRLEGWTFERQRLALRYRSAFAAKRLDPSVRLELPHEAPGARHVYHHFVIRAPRRDELRRHLAERGIATAVYYPEPMHLQPCFRSWGHVPGDFPESERAAKETLALPLYPELPEASLLRVVDEVAAFLERSR
jgi:dTDP-4-amino-4,6-dideoxygalactose transaminase